MGKLPDDWSFVISAQTYYILVEADYDWYFWLEKSLAITDNTNIDKTKNFICN